VAWLVVVPLGIFFASPKLRSVLFPNDKESNPKYTKAHKITACVAVVLALVGFILGFFVIGSHTYIAHLTIGSIVLCLVAVQIMGGVWRSRIFPMESENSSNIEKFSRSHKHQISLAHSILGRLIWSLALANAFIGLTIYTGIWL
jgi:hypothetical protein